MRARGMGGREGEWWGVDVEGVCGEGFEENGGE